MPNSKPSRDPYEREKPYKESRDLRKDQDSLWDEPGEINLDKPSSGILELLKDLESELYDNNRDEGFVIPYPNDADFNLTPLHEFHEKPSSVITSTLSEKIDFLRETIKKIKSQIRCRRSLTKEFLHEIQEEISSVSFLLKELNKTWRQLGQSQAIEFRRGNLERKISDLRKELRINKLNSWKDVVWLEKELRDILREYLSLMRILKSLYGENES